jgi:hypothetical protein
VCGPPDEIQTEPRPMTVSDHPSPATQEWRYSDGRKFQFIDDCDCGQFELQVPTLK